MAAATKSKNSAITCAHAESLFSRGNMDTDVRRAEKFCRTVHQFVLSKPEGPLYTRQPLLPVAPTLRPSSNELFYTFTPGAQIDSKKQRALENPATDEEKVRQRFGKEPGHYYGLLASHIAMDLARNKTRTPREKLISKMESSFTQRWRAKQESLGVKFGVYDENGDQILSNSDAGGVEATGATGANSNTGSTGASSNTGSTGEGDSSEESMPPEQKEDREKKEEMERVARLYKERLVKEI